MVQAAWAAYRAKGTHLRKKFCRIAASRGKKRAAIAVAHAILVIAYHVLKKATTYKESAGSSEVA